MEDRQNEKDFLNSLTSTYKMDGSVYNQKKREIVINLFSRFIHGGKALELGCADGYETELISKLVDKLDVIDGSRIFIDNCKKKEYKNVNFIYELFETYSIPESIEKYDYVFATYVLEHVVDIKFVFNMIRQVLKPEGLLFIVVPNALALSRQLALSMGIINGLKDLTQNDIDHGHKRVYDWFDLNKDIEINCFEIVEQGGTVFKILADFQMDKLLNDGFLTDYHLKGLLKLGKMYPEFCDSIYAICHLNCSPQRQTGC
jgi:2-polyprenyl-3-methyl-5-hydroxy-6-metoxy-1,4-benzoquinol methylase